MGQAYISLVGGQTISQFRFVSETGGVDVNHQSVTGATYHLGLDYYAHDKLYISGGLGYKNTGSSMEIDQTEIAYDIDYLDFQLKGGVSFFKQTPYQQSILSPYIELGIYVGMALKGTQTIGDVYYDLLKEDAINRTDAGVVGGGGLMIQPLAGFRVRIGAYYQRGILSIENSADQSTYNKVISVEAGLLFSLSRGHRR
jgi:hypothetical protein